MSEMHRVLLALAGELTHARDVAEALDAGVGRLVAGRADAICEVQAIDRLRQTLDDLAAFTAALAGTTLDGRGAGQDDLARALLGVRLRDVADRLAGRRPATGEDEFWDF